MNTTKVSGIAIAAVAASLFVLAPLATAADSAAATGKCLGGNSCKGQSSCKSFDHGCKGQNSCKGKWYRDGRLARLTVRQGQAASLVPTAASKLTRRQDLSDVDLAVPARRAGSSSL